MKFFWLILLSWPAWSKPVNCSIPAQPHQKLSATCLKSVLAGENFDNLKYFEPTHTLYSNNADKRRWIYLPVGSKIDTKNPDGWIYPIDTILWKEFALNGRRIETRMLEKVKAGSGTGSWRSSVYLWKEDQTDADWSSDGQTTASPNTKYELIHHKEAYTVPSTNSCNMCHRSSADMSLGFSYLNLSGQKKPGYRLSDLSSDKWLSPDLTTPDQIAGSEQDQKVLGYMHMNCASCHSPRGMASYVFQVNHVSGTKTLKEENGFKNTVGVNGPSSRPLIYPGDAARSYIFERLSNGQMPPDYAVRKHGIDQKAKTMLYEWIDSLPHGR